MKQESFYSFYKRYAHALTNISEAKEHSTNGGFLCEEKQAIQTSNAIGEAHDVGERSNFKKIPTHMQDHGDAQQREGRVCPRTLVDQKRKR